MMNSNVSNRILLLNLNSFSTPPVPPIGLEYLVGSLRDRGHEVRIVDLHGSDDLTGDTLTAADDFKPLAVGITIRNLDTALRESSFFFLPELKPVVKALKEKGLHVILGGSGFSIAPDMCMSYLGADAGVIGPGEEALCDIMEALSDSKDVRGVLDGWLRGADPYRVHVRGRDVDLKAYERAGGIAGFETHKGCSHSCSYCVEACTRILPRDPDAVVEEVRQLARAGHMDLHLCDSELNEDLLHAAAVCKGLSRHVPGIRWSAYIRPVPFQKGFAALMKSAGVWSVTLSIESAVTNSANRHEYGLEEITDTIKSCRDQDIRVAVDLMTGMHGESFDNLEKMIKCLHLAEPDQVNINPHLRVYPGTGLRRILEAFGGTLEPEPDPSFPYLGPVFHTRFEPERIQQLIKNLPGFALESASGQVNYQRLDDKEKKDT